MEVKEQPTSTTEAPVTTIAQIGTREGQSVTIRGWLYNLRESGKLLFPIFRDREELPASHDLSQEVRAALGASRSLIVICSPDARASQWVSREVEVFRALHPDRPVLAELARSTDQKMMKPENWTRWLMACTPSTYIEFVFAYSRPHRMAGVMSAKRFTSNQSVAAITLLGLPIVPTA